MIGFHPVYRKVLVAERANTALPLICHPLHAVGEGPDGQHPLVPAQYMVVDTLLLCDIPSCINLEIRPFKDLGVQLYPFRIYYVLIPTPHLSSPCGSREMSG
jgi:hypothetical protein